MALLAVQSIVRAGTAPVFAAAAASNWFPNDGRTFATVRNGSASAITVTINSVGLCDQGFDHDETVSVPAGTDRMIGPFPRDRFNNLDGRVTLLHSAITTVTIGVFSLS